MDPVLDRVIEAPLVIMNWHLFQTPHAFEAYSIAYFLCGPSREQSLIFALSGNLLKWITETKWIFAV